MTNIDRNAAESAFGWQFQIHSAIVLALKSIKEMSSITVEGNAEDIEVELQDGTRVYCQAKAHYRANDPGDGSTTRLRDAMATLLEDLSQNDCLRAVYVTNDRLPFGKRVDSSNFNGGAYFAFGELEPEQQKVIEKYIDEVNGRKVDCSNLRVLVIPFFGEDEPTRMKAIDGAVSGFLATIESADARGVSSTRLRAAWSRMLGFDATLKPDGEAKTISKKAFVWPIVYEVCDAAPVGSDTLDVDDDVFEDVVRKYKGAISAQSDLFSVSTRIISDFEQFRASSSSANRYLVNEYSASKWEQYVDDLGASEICDGEERRAYVQLILFKVLKKRSTMKEVANAVKLRD